jgi:hypothetical protein
MKRYLAWFITFLAIVGLLFHLLFWLSLTSVIKPSLFQYQVEKGCTFYDPNLQKSFVCDAGDSAYYYAFFTVFFVYPPTIVISFLVYVLLSFKKISAPTWKIVGIVLGIFTVGYVIMGLVW